MRVGNPISMLGGFGITVFGGACRRYWRKPGVLYEDGSVLYTGFQRKFRRDVGWSAMAVFFCFFPIAAWLDAIMNGAEVLKSTTNAIFCLGILPVTMICFRHFVADLSNSQMMYAVKDAGFTDDVFPADEEDEDDDLGEYEDELENDEEIDKESGNVVDVDFGQGQSDDDDFWGEKFETGD